MKYTRRFLALTLSAALAVSCAPLSAAAAGTEDEKTDTSAVAGSYTEGGLTLVLGDDGSFSLSGEGTEVTGTFTYEEQNGWGGPSTNVYFDDMDALSDVMSWYSYVRLGDGTFTITKDVSMALTDNDDIDVVTVADSSSKTGYMTTFTVKDNGYENVYAYGDWVADYKVLTDENDPASYSQEIHNPDEWENGMNYYTSSVLEMTKDDTTGAWTLSLPLASSVMGIACYHDVDEADLVDLFPQKKSFYIPYDSEKQSASLDWSPAFPASENGNPAGTLTEANTGSVDISVYTPAGYDAGDTDTQYPVLYLIAGGGSTHLSWFTQGMAGNIFDNLSAENKTEDTILVAMGFQDVRGSELQDEVIPYIEASYNVYTDAEHRALGGVSMGSVTATNIWMADPDLFSYYAFLSGADKDTFQVSEYPELDGELLEKLKDASCYIGGGTTDFNMFAGDANSASVTELDAWMDNYGIEHNTAGDGNYEIAMGDHNWPIWMQLMIPFASDYLWQNTDNTGGLTLNVTSDILGLADTGNKSTLKVDLINTGGPGDTALYYYNEEGQRVQYEDQDGVYALESVHYTGSAVLDLGDVDDSLIDSSNAAVRLIDGNGYYAEELILSERAQKLDGEWVNGRLTYTLTTGDLEWNTWDYYDTDYEKDYNSGREWSMMGGDGNGVYFFTLEVSGITYDGEEVPAAKIPVAVYIYGRSSADLGLSTEFIENTYDEDYTSGLAQTDEIQWKWYTENEDSVNAGEPYMNDPYSDYFSVVWPAGTDASGITAEDVTVTLRSVYGDEYVLSEQNPYGEREYAVLSRSGETEVVVTYQQWAYVPVYSTMEISISKDGIEASKTYDISSVTTYLVQTGGGGVTVDHTVTVYNHYGIGGMTLENAVNTEYTLSTEIDGTTYYYAEDENGEGYLVEAVQVPNAWGFGTTAGAPDEAWKGDGTEKYHIAVYNNVVFVETRLDNTEVKVVDGQEITFTENLSATKSDEEMIAAGAYLEPGYNLNGSSADKWSWTFRYQSGWTTDSAEPDSLPYASVYPYGYEPGTPEEERPYYGMEVLEGPGGSGGPGETDEPGEAEDPGTVTEPDGTADSGTAPETGTSGNQAGNTVQTTSATGTSSGSGTSGTASSGNAPRTGDSAVPAVWIFAMIICGTAAAGCIYRKKRY